MYGETRRDALPRLSLCASNAGFRSIGVGSKEGCSKLMFRNVSCSTHFALLVEERELKPQHPRLHRSRIALLERATPGS